MGLLGFAPSARKQNGTALFLIPLCSTLLLGTSVNGADKGENELGYLWKLENVNGKYGNWDLALNFGLHGRVDLEIQCSPRAASDWAGTWKSPRHAQIELSRLSVTKYNPNCSPEPLLNQLIQHWTEIRSYRVSNDGTDLVLVLPSDGSKWQFANGQLPPKTPIEIFKPNGQIETFKP
jgi:hypothetical protein